MSYTKNIIKYSRIYPCETLPITSVKNKDKCLDFDLDRANFVKTCNIKNKPSENLFEKNSHNDINNSTDLEDYSDSDYYYYYNIMPKDLVKKNKTNKKVCIYNDNIFRNNYCDNV